MNPIAARMLRLGLSLGVLVIVSSVLVELAVERNERNLLEARQDAGLDLGTNIFVSDMASVDSDLAVVSTFEEVVPALDPADEDARARLARVFVTFARSKRVYDQVRLLGSDGRERVRVNYREGRATVVPDAELQDKSNHPYFSESVALEPGRVYVAPIDLNVEQGVVAEPLTPTARFATPVAEGRKGAHGVVVINYLARRTFDRLEHAVAANAGRVVLVDEAGFFLRGRTPEEEWGGQLPGRAASRFGAAFPDAWKVVKSAERGTVRTARGLFAFRTVRPGSFVSRPGGPGAPWKIVSVISAQEARAVERRFLAVVGIVDGVVLVLIGVVLSLAAVRQIQAAETERRALDQLREAEERYRLLFQRNLAGVYRSTLDGRLLECNPAFLKILGFESREELDSRRTTSLYVDPEDRARLIDRLLTEGFVSNHEMRLLRKDGSEAWVLLNIGLAPAPAGAPRILEGTLFDISKRKRTEEALRAGERRMRALLDNMLAGILMVDGRGVIQLVNPAAERMFGYSSDELIGKPLRTLVPERSGADIGVFLQEALGKAMGRITVWEGRRKNGDVFPFELALFQFETPEGLRIAGSFVDVTERREVERLKNEFVSTVSHELRTPLTSIRGSLGLLRSGAVGALSAEAEDLVAVAERNVIRLIGLINDILDLERLADGRIELHIVSVPADGITARALEAVHAFAEQHEIPLEAPPSGLTVRADADRLVQVLVNLISNAVKFSPRGSGVTVSATALGDMAEFRVADRGRGIPPALRASIFERFRQVEAGDAREKGGTGLGLAICKAIVEQHGGAIGVESETGQGSTFWFRVPLAVGVPISAAASTAQAPLLALLVDDDVELLTVLARQLREQGIGVRSATSVAEAVEAVHEVKPDLLVLDLGLPDGDGQRVVDALRGEPELSQLPLLVYTARDLTLRDRQSLVLGPTRHLTKSKATDEEVVRAVTELIHAGRAGRSPGASRPG